MKRITFREDFLDPHLLGASFPAPDSWRPWLTAADVLYGLPLGEDGLELFQRCTGLEEPPGSPVRDAFFIVGRRGGKSRITAALAVHEAVFADTSLLAPGETGLVAVVAPDRDQGGIILNYCRRNFQRSAILNSMVEADLSQEIRLTNGVAIRVLTCSTASVRGYTLIACILEEASFWRVEGRDPGKEIVRSLKPALATTGGPLIAISTPYARSGIMWDAWKKHYGVESSILVWSAPTTVMNPTLPQELVDEALADDPESAAAEWLAIFRKDVEALLPVEVIEGVVVQGRHGLPMVPGTRYYAFCDPSGGRQDSAALGVAHREKDMAVLDYCGRWPAPHDPGAVTAEMVGILRHYGINEVTGDNYAGSFPAQEFLRHGIRYIASNRNKSQIYIDMVPAIMTARVELLDDKRLVAELAGLERRTRANACDLVDHAPGGHDDLSNAVAGAVGLVARPVHICIVEQASF